MYFQSFSRTEALALFQEKRTLQNRERCTEGFRNDHSFGKLESLEVRLCLTYP